METTKREQLFTLVVAKTSQDMNGRTRFLAYMPDDSFAIEGDIIRLNISGHHICAEVIYKCSYIKKGDDEWVGLSRVVDMEPMKVEAVYHNKEVKWK